MPKIVSLIILGGLVIAALAAFNINGVNARAETKFVQFSVLAEDRANYGVDENSSLIPAVSVDIIKDKVHDLGSASTIPIIKYTSLPAKTPKTARHDNDESQTVNESEPHENNGKGNSVNNGNGGSNQNQNNNGNSGSNQNNGKQKEKGTKPDKGSGSSNSNSNSDSNSNSNDNSTVDVGSKGNSAINSK